VECCDVSEPVSLIHAQESVRHEKVEADLWIVQIDIDKAENLIDAVKKGVSVNMKGLGCPDKAPFAFYVSVEGLGQIRAVLLVETSESDQAGVTQEDCVLAGAERKNVIKGMFFVRK
jgi:hypothetical protein